MREDGLNKFPRTPHLVGSNVHDDDKDMKLISWNDIANQRLTVTEKVDGSNVGISISPTGQLQLQSRGHYLTGGPREKQYDILKQWSTSRASEFSRALGERFVLYGEWLYAKHTCFYDALPHLFMVIDILDRNHDRFLDTASRQIVCRDLKLFHAPVIHDGPVKNFFELSSMIKRSQFISEKRGFNLLTAAREAGVDPVLAAQHTDPSHDMEGVYIKVETDTHVALRCKLVRKSFSNAISEQDQHWHDRPIIKNGMQPGAFSAMFG